MEPETDPNYGYAQYDLAIRELVVVVLVMSIVVVPPILCYFFDRRSRRRHLSPLILPTATALDPSLFEFLPTLTYSSSSSATAHRPPPECAICLTDFQEGDEGRMLPNCNHVFHCHCIDMWFLSHSNCPMCRAPVRPPRISSLKDNTEASVSVGFSNLSLPAPIWCTRKPLEKMELVEVRVQISGKDDDERLRRTSESESDRTA